MLAANPEGILDALSKPEIKDLGFGAALRFLVPKDELSYRQATQLDAQDGLVLTTLVRQFGQGIENRRLAPDIVFSYRFDAAGKNGLYFEQSDWNSFWEKAAEESARCDEIVYCDITDFYNQIYHHTVENQLAESGFPNQAVKWIIGLLEETTAGVSRGVPIGPHAVHLVAEASLIPVDNALEAQGVKFLRYADDMVVFCSAEMPSRTVLSIVAQTLDRAQRLTLQRHKTRVMKRDEFRRHAAKMVEDQPISENESDLLALIKKYSNGNPYRTVQLSEISVEDWEALSAGSLAAIVESYLSADSVDYTRLSWFYRRLAQVGHPGALDATLDNLDRLVPCLPSVVNYVASLQNIDSTQWRQAGQRLIEALSNPAFQQQEYFEISLLGLFGRNPALNHFQQLGGRWKSSTPAARRQLILAASANSAVDWLRLLKEDYANMDGGQKLAYIFAMAAFPRDERRYFIQRNISESDRPFLRAVSRLSRGQQ